jgi:prepilin-type N-terminal cleavage/methylation domain-containing protein
VTLVELLVVLAILAIVAGVSTVALRRMDASQTAGVNEQLRALHRAAIRDGRTHTGVVRDGASTHVVTALPDGRIYADPAMHVDPTTGARHADTP